MQLHLSTASVDEVDGRLMGPVPIIAVSKMIVVRNRPPKIDFR